MAQRGLLGFNSEPFADIPDDEVAGDLEMLMREMGQPRAAPAAAPRAQTVRQRTPACGLYVSVVCVWYCCAAAAVSLCARRGWWW